MTYCVYCSHSKDAHLEGTGMCQACAYIIGRGVTTGQQAPIHQCEHFYELGEEIPDNGM